MGNKGKNKNIKLTVFLILIITATRYLYDTLKLNQKCEKLETPSEILKELLKNNPEVNTTTGSNESAIDYLKKYPFILNCQKNYNPWNTSMARDKLNYAYKYNYSAPSPKEYHQIRITRAVIVNFPIDGISNYEPELRWLYRSWIHMMNYEPKKWRTDLIVFIENDPVVFNKSYFFFNQLNCSFDAERKSETDKPMCKLINYRSFKNRTPTKPVEHTKTFKTVEDKYIYMLRDLDIFKTDDINEFSLLYGMLDTFAKNYRYLDSVLIAFEGYIYLRFY